MSCAVLNLPCNTQAICCLEIYYVLQSLVNYDVQGSTEGHSLGLLETCFMLVCTINPTSLRPIVDFLVVVVPHYGVRIKIRDPAF